MLAEQENQENVPPAAKAPPPAAGTRVALGLLRGGPARPGLAPQVSGEARGAADGRAPSWGGGRLSGRLSRRADGPLPQAARNGEGRGAAAGQQQQQLQQQPFSVYVDEPDGERQRPQRKKERDEDAAADAPGLRAALGTLGERRPLAPLGNAMELSLGKRRPCPPRRPGRAPGLRNAAPAAGRPAAAGRNWGVGMGLGSGTGLWSAACVRRLGKGRLVGRVGRFLLLSRASASPRPARLPDGRPPASSIAPAGGGFCRAPCYRGPCLPPRFPEYHGYLHHFRSRRETKR